MKTIKTLLGAALIGSLLSASVFGSVDDYRKLYYTTRTDVPLPVKVVNPTDLPRRYLDATVMLELTVDKSGQPRDITVLRPIDPELAQSLIPTLAQWRFSPAQRDGQPVTTRIVLPIKLNDGS